MPHLTPTFRRRSKAPVRAVPVPVGATPPKAARAARAGFGEQAGQVAEILTRRRRLLLVRADADLEAAGAIAVARLPLAAHLAIDARAHTPEQAASLAAGAVLRAWRFDRLKTRPDPDQPRLSRLDILVEHPAAARAAWAALEPGIRGTLFARDLVVEPGNVLTPARFAERLQLLQRHGLTLEVFDTDRLRAEGFGGVVAVGGASANPPCLAILRWPGTLNAAPVMFVGKGITFDTGGVCIKPAQGLWEMRADMAGAAAAAGAMLALALRHSASPAIAVLALAENAIGASSYRPGDVLTMYSGTTVEVVDTDAEGRLVLADALAWGAAQQPQAIIDLATLTGSIITALGHEHAGLFASSDVLAGHLAEAGAAVDERTWRMPLSAAYGEALESDIADIRHCVDGSLQPDACHAARFLHGFTGDIPWVHLDIAGVEGRERASDRHGAGPTGWGPRLLDRLVKDRFESPDREHRTV
ncbi:MAG: leucyl aminopeptidase family protein [Janthinobacterium lividum]